MTEVTKYSKLNKNHQNLIFKANFSCQKSVKSFCFFGSVHDIRLGVERYLFSLYDANLFDILLFNSIYIYSCTVLLQLMGVVISTRVRGP